MIGSTGLKGHKPYFLSAKVTQLVWGRVCTVLGGHIKNRKLPVLNQGQRDLAITMSGKSDMLMGHLKTILVAQCDEQPH